MGSVAGRDRVGEARQSEHRAWLKATVRKGPIVVARWRHHEVPLLRPGGWDRSILGVTRPGNKPDSVSGLVVEESEAILMVFGLETVGGRDSATEGTEVSEERAGES